MQVRKQIAKCIYSAGVQYGIIMGYSKINILQGSFYAKGS
jgi:hypothetical protein